MTAEADDTLVQPRKTSNTHKGLRYLGQGETPGGATTSPGKANRRREGQHFTNSFTQDVSPQNLNSIAAVRVLSAGPDETRSCSSLPLVNDSRDSSMLNKSITFTTERHQQIGDNTEDDDNLETSRTHATNIVSTETTVAVGTAPVVNPSDDRGSYISSVADPMEAVSNESSLLKEPILTQPLVYPNVEDDTIAVNEEDQSLVDNDY